MYVYLLTASKWQVIGTYVFLQCISIELQQEEKIKFILEISREIIRIFF